MKVYVITLADAAERQENAARQLKAANIDFQFVYPLDCLCEYVRAIIVQSEDEATLDRYAVLVVRFDIAFIVWDLIERFVDRIQRGGGNGFKSAKQMLKPVRQIMSAVSAFIKQAGDNPENP